MKNFIEIDGVSSQCFGLWMDKLPLWPISTEVIETVSMPGVAVDTGRPTGRYQDYSLTLTGYLTKRPCSDLLSRLSALRVCRCQAPNHASFIVAGETLMDGLLACGTR